MALTILDENGVFKISGDVNSSTSKHFEDHFKEIMKKNGEITINIDKVNHIDKTGVTVLRNLYFYCLMNCNVALHITGNGCKEIYDDFRNVKLINR